MSANANPGITLRLRGVSRTFDAGSGSCTAAVAALREASIEIRGGEVLIITGPAGAGKTTLLLCAAGLLHCDSGDVGRNGRPAVYLDLATTSLDGIAWTPGTTMFIDSCDDVGGLPRARLVSALDGAIRAGAAVVLAGRDARACLALAPATSTVSVVHLRLGQITSHRDEIGVVHRVAEGAGRGR